MAEDALNRRET